MHVRACWQRCQLRRLNGDIRFWDDHDRPWWLMSVMPILGLMTKSSVMSMKESQEDCDFLTCLMQPTFGASGRPQSVPCSVFFPGLYPTPQYYNCGGTEQIDTCDLIRPATVHLWRSTCNTRSHIQAQGSIFWSENDIYPPPLLKMIFFPLSWHVVFWLPSWSFCLIFGLFCIYFTLLLPLFSFSFPFIFLSSFFLLHFPLFSLRLFISPPPNDIGRYSPPLGGGGGGVFSNIDPCSGS